MSITVVENENRRIGSMSSSEIDQCVLDIKTWFCRHDERFNEEEGASRSEIESLEKTLDIELDLGLEILLKLINGHIWFMEKEFLSIQQIKKIIRANEDLDTWKEGYLPFAVDVDGGLYIIDHSRRGHGEVFEWDDSDGLGDKEASSFDDYLERYRNHLLSNSYEYIEDIGVVEKLGVSGK